MAAVATFQIPSQLKQFDLRFPCTEEQTKEAIVVLARQVAHVYARLLTLQGHQDRGTEFFFFVADSPLTEKFPTTDQVDNFEKQLAKAIVDKFQEPDGGVVGLSVHYAPEKILGDVMNNCGITAHAFKLARYFPCKMHTDISFSEDQQIIRVHQWDGI